MACRPGEVEHFWVLHRRQIESVWGRRYTAKFPAATNEDIQRPLRVLFTSTDLQKHTGKISHHVLQESVRFNAQKKEISASSNIKRVDRPDWVSRLATASAKSRKVMLTEPVSCCNAHPLEVQRQAFPGHFSRPQAGAGRPVQNQVIVSPTYSSESRVKTLGDFSRPEDVDIRG